MNAPLGNLDDLVAQVRRRAEQRALVVETAAEAQARRIAEEGDVQARAASAALVEAGRRAADDARRRRLAAADLDRRRRRLEAREARIERVWAAARTELERLDATPAGRSALARLARDAAARLGGAEVVVQVDRRALADLSPAEVAAWAAPGGPSFRLHPEPLAQGPGLVAHAGRTSVDATYDGRLAQARERLRSDVDALLGGAP